MTRRLFLFSIISNFWHRYCKLLLNLVWIIGFITGIISAVSCGDSLGLLIRSIVDNKASISGLLVAGFLPLLFTVFAVMTCQPWMLPLISGAKAFAFGFCASGVGLTFHHSAWLIRFLLLFTDCLTIPMLFWFSLRHISDTTVPIRKDVTILFLLIAMVVCLDYCFISPFLAMLFQ